MKRKAGRRCSSTRRRGRATCRLRREDGFTFVEVLVALVLFSVLAVGLVAGLLGAQRLIGRVAREASGSARLLQLDELLRREAGSVRVPFWVRAPEVQADPQRLSVPYRGGDPEDRLILESREGWLSVESAKAGRLSLFGPFEAVDLGLERGSDGGAWGLRVEVGFAPQGRAVIRARFAGRGL